MRPGRGTLAGCVAAVLVLSGCGGQEPAAASGPQSAGPSLPPAVLPSPSPLPPVLDPAAAPAPVAVAIPSIGVRSSLVELGIAADGSAEVPEDFGLAGWFEGGGRPGARGPTVLLGHVDSAAGPAVFHDLRELAPGDVVEVTVADGSVAHYSVTGAEQVAKDGFPTVAVFGATTDDVLRLVTCSGDFDRGARSYVDNLVVTAVRVV